MNNTSVHEKTKRLIRSILTSNPCSMTIRSLAKDYRAMVDQKGIPYSELGYNSLEHYLRSIPDVLQVQGNGLEANLVLVVSAKNSHINALVVKQKIESKRNVPPHQRRRRPHVLAPAPPCDAPHSESYEYISSSSDLETAATSPVVEQPAIHQAATADVDSRMRKSLEEACHRNSQKAIGVPKMVKSQLANLILRHPEGIWCRDLPKVFHRNYGKTLNFQEYGYANLIDMISMLSTLFQYVQLEMGDFLLFHANQTIPEEVLRKSNEIDDDKSTEISATELDNSRQLDYPKDVLRLGKSVKGLSASKVAKNINCSAFDVVVTHSSNPYSFWLYFKDFGLERLTNEIHDCFSNNASAYKMPVSHLIKGLYCVKMIQNQYYRVLVRDVQNDGILVCLIDYGIKVLTKNDDFYFLPIKFATVEAQAVHCTLYNVFPKPAFEPWSDKAKEYFQNIVNSVNGEFQLLIKKVCPVDASHHFQVELSYRDKDKIVNLNNKLVYAGFALIGDDVREMYSYN